MMRRTTTSSSTSRWVACAGSLWRVGALQLLLMALDMRRVELLALFERVLGERHPARILYGHPARVELAVQARVLAGAEELLRRNGNAWSTLP